jgi:hypothetical protein
LDRYTHEIRRLEGRPEEEQEVGRPMVVRLQRRWPSGVTQEPSEKGEIIQERFMDSRYGAAPTMTQEGSTTLLEQMADAGMDFLAASGKNISEGIAVVNNLLDFDSELELGKFSPLLGRLNAPKLYVSRNCPNLIYALREYTGRDGMKGACKDFVDLMRYAALAELGYIGADAYCWQGGGPGY